MLQLGFEGSGVPGRALFVGSYKNKGTMCHVMCLVPRIVTKYNPILPTVKTSNFIHIKLTFKA